MVILSIILGILLIIAGVSCAFTPLGTFMAAGYLICIVMLIFGIVGIVRGFQKKATALEVVVSVLALIVGIVALFRPGDKLVLDTIVLYLLSAWFVCVGVVSIVESVQDRGSGWVLGLIIGIICVILGLYSFVHPMFTAVTAGILIGFFFIGTGISLISFSMAAGSEE